MTRERAAELLSDVTVLDDPEMEEAHKMAISALRQQEHRCPCDLCNFGPPSSMRGKPCTMCPAIPKQETVTNRNGLNEPLTLDELRNMAGSWVWVVVNYEHCKCDGWALVPTPAYVAFLDQMIPTDFYGKKFVAYDHKPEEDSSND